MTLQESCDKASEHLIGKRKELQQLVAEYRECSEDGRSPLDLLDIRDKITAFSFDITTVMLRSKELHLQAQRKREAAYNTVFLTERGTVGDNGKPQSIETCKLNAQLKIAQDYITEHLAEINYFSARAYRDECQRLIDACAQRVSVVKGEQFNSRQTSAA